MILADLRSNTVRVLRSVTLTPHFTRLFYEHVRHQLEVGQAAIDAQPRDYLARFPDPAGAVPLALVREKAGALAD